jgi:formylmethanofuran dehydrogenase subunit E
MENVAIGCIALLHFEHLEYKSYSIINQEKWPGKSRLNCHNLIGQLPNQSNRKECYPLLNRRAISDYNLVKSNKGLGDSMDILTQLLERSASYHHHLCPRQVLGVRMGLLAGEVLQLEVPQPFNSKRLFTIVETDGCAADGVAIATNCWVGRRTLRVEDFGKVAATFVDTKSGIAVRITPRRAIRTEAGEHAPEARNKWQAMLLGYQRMPINQLLMVQMVTLNKSIEEIISRPRKKAICGTCGEEILNEREIVGGGMVRCRSCAGDTYYALAPAFSSSSPPETAPLPTQE